MKRRRTITRMLTDPRVGDLFVPIYDHNPPLPFPMPAPDPSLLPFKYTIHDVPTHR